MRRLLTVIICFCLLTIAAVSSALAKQQEGIAAVVNQGVVTMSDLNDRAELIAISSGLKPSKDMMEKLRPQVLNILIEEQIRLQEATRAAIKVEDKEIDEGFESIAKQNNIPAAEFAKMLKSHGINVGTMRDQIKSQLAWTKLVQKRIRPRVEVTDADIDSELDRIKEKIGKDQYLLGEILIPLRSEDKKADAEGFARKLAEKLKVEPQAFPKAAKEFSAAPGAEKGGTIGWMMAGQMAEEIDAVLPTMAAGKIAGPIKTTSGYVILLLKEKRQLTVEKLPSREDIMERVGMQRLERAAQRYFMDARSMAFIEKRV
jgi:peptidyl-prolyl cis-trans isomerase SurA